MLSLSLTAFLAIADDSFVQRLERLEIQYKDTSTKMSALRDESGKLAVEWDSLQKEFSEKRLQWDTLYNRANYLMNQRGLILSTPPMNFAHEMYLRNSLMKVDILLNQTQITLKQLWDIRPLYYQRQAALQKDLINNRYSITSLSTQIALLQNSIEQMRPLADREKDKAVLIEKANKTNDFLTLAKKHEESLLHLQRQLDTTLKEVDKYFDKQKSEYYQIKGIAL